MRRSEVGNQAWTGQKIQSGRGGTGAGERFCVRQDEKLQVMYGGEVSPTTSESKPR